MGPRQGATNPQFQIHLENKVLTLAGLYDPSRQRARFNAEFIVPLLQDFRGRLAESDCKVLSALTVASPLPVTRVERVRKCYVKRYLPNTTDALGAAEAKGLHQINRAIA